MVLYSANIRMAQASDTVVLVWAEQWLQWTNKHTAEPRLHSFHGPLLQCFRAPSAVIVLRASRGSLLDSFTEFHFILGLLKFAAIIWLYSQVSLPVSPPTSPCDKRNVYSGILANPAISERTAGHSC